MPLTFIVEVALPTSTHLARLSHHGPERQTPHAGRGPDRRHREQLLGLVFLFATVLAANQCGAFGDACDDDGTTSTTFFVMLALTFLAIVASLASRS